MSVRRTCKCCGKEYEYCPNCQKENNPPWMVSFHNETCKDLFNLVSAYNLGLTPREKVQQFAREKGINFQSYPDAVRKVLDSDMSTYVRKKKNHTGYRFDYTTRDIQ